MHNYLETLRRGDPVSGSGQRQPAARRDFGPETSAQPEVAWEMKAEDEGEAAGATLTVPRRDDRAGQLISLIFRIPASRSIELDELGRRSGRGAMGSTASINSSSLPARRTS